MIYPINSLALRLCQYLFQSGQNPLLQDDFHQPKAPLRCYNSQYLQTGSRSSENLLNAKRLINNSKSRSQSAFKLAFIYFCGRDHRNANFALCLRCIFATYHTFPLQNAKKLTNCRNFRSQSAFKLAFICFCGRNQCNANFVLHLRCTFAA